MKKLAKVGLAVILAVILSDSHADGVDIYVYHDGDVAEAGRDFGSRGAFLFLPRGNLICSTFFNMGEGFMSFYRIEGAESMELQAFHDCLAEYGGRYLPFPARAGWDISASTGGESAWGREVKT